MLVLEGKRYGRKEQEIREIGWVCLGVCLVFVQLAVVCQRAYAGESHERLGTWLWSAGDGCSCLLAAAVMMMCSCCGGQFQLLSCLSLPEFYSEPNNEVSTKQTIGESIY